MPSHGDKDIGATSTDKNTQAEIASGVDSSKVRDSQRWAKGAISEFIGRTLPRQFSSSSSGGASVNVGGNGAKCSPGATAGDSCDVSTFDTSHIDTDSLRYKRMTFEDRGTGVPYTDECRLGFPSISSYQGAFLDFVSEEVVVKDDGKGSDTRVAVNTPSTGVLEVWRSENGATWRFLCHRRGKVIFDETISAAWNNQARACIYMESNGAGDEMAVHHLTDAIIPEETL